MICRVVPAEHESPCTNKAGANKPRLCSMHHREYVARTTAYKNSQELAEEFYERISWLIGSGALLLPLLSIGAVEEAFRTTQRCIAALDKEIREREAHHKRFFVQGKWSMYRLACGSGLGCTSG